jgi:hypothetical protein
MYTVQLNANCHKNVHNLNYSLKAIDIVDKKIPLVKSMTITCNVRDSYKLSKNTEKIPAPLVFLKVLPKLTGGGIFFKLFLHAEYKDNVY